MHELHELKEKLTDLLIEYGDKDMTASNLDVIDKLTHTIKNLCKIIDGDDGYSKRMVYADRRRDAMGRYTSSDGIIKELHKLSDEAPDQKTRMEIDRLIRKMEM